MKATKQREAAAELDSSTAGASNKHKRGGHDSDSEGDSDAPDATDADGSNQVYGGTVSFVDGTKSMTAKRAKKKKDSQKVRDAKRNADNEDEPPAKAPRTHLEAGALAHSGSTNVPGASRSQVFGAEHATSFQQLGISKVRARDCCLRCYARSRLLDMLAGISRGAAAVPTQGN